MSVELPSQEGATSRTAGRALDLSTAGLALARVAVGALAETPAGRPDVQIETLIRASEQVIAAVGALPELRPEQRKVATEISHGLSALTAGLSDSGQVSPNLGV